MSNVLAGQNPTDPNICPNSTCNERLALNATRCHACQEPVDLPNIRFANRAEERVAFAELSALADEAILVAGTQAVAARFQTAVNSSAAVMNRSLGAIHTWIASPSKLFQNFYVDMLVGRVPVDDEWNRQRISAENGVSPQFYSGLSVAALSLDDTGMSYYGDYTVVLKDDLIAKRATVFEENPFKFHERFGKAKGTDPEPGHRAHWAERGRLALNKLHPKLEPAMNDGEFPTVLMSPDRDSEKCDFIEVHIWEAVHAKSIERVVGPEPSEFVDKALWAVVLHRAAEQGIDVRQT